MMVATFAELPPPPLAPEDEDTDRYVFPSPYFTRHVTPNPSSAWVQAGHVRVKWQSDATPDYVKLSPTVVAILRAVEDLWAARGHLVSV